MKRRKDEEKTMGPMFPRLHVNDTEKGGPRAPPRNKMALYEQLSIPSQTFSRAVLPCNPNSTAANLVPPSSQVPLRPQSEKLNSQYSHLSTPLEQVEQIKKLDEDDYRVPIFIHSTPSQECDKYTNDMDREKVLPSNPSYFNHSLKFQRAKEKSMLEHSMRLLSKNQKGENPEEFVAGQIKAISNSSFIEKTEGLKKQTDSSLYHEPGDNPTKSIYKWKTNDSVLPELCAERQPFSDRHSTAVLRENIAAIDKRTPTSARALPEEDHNSVHDLSNDSESRENGSCRSMHMGNLERDDSVSETSILDSISGVDVTPDDVVGIMGQKHFWKARRAIVNQQRVFAVQVFELHRLIKVQKLIAASPQLLLEESAYLGKPVKSSPRKKLPLAYAVKAIPNAPKQKGTEKPSDRKEFSAENTVEKVSFPSPQNGAPPSSCRPLSGHSPAPSLVNNDHNARPWCFNQPPQGHQWLIPVMSPSEGLVYKPYAGPGLIGQAYGGSGPPGSNPTMGNFLTPAYGVPAPPPQYQLPSFPPAGPHSYFPPYGMPIMNTAAFSGSSVEKTYPTAFPGRFSAGDANFSTPHHNLFTMPSQKNGADALNSLAFEDIEVQASTESSPSERREGSRASSDMEGRNMLPLFPTSPAIDASNTSSQPPEPEWPARVIKVVPHNARSASESAARIFLSIQEERKQYDSA